MSEPTSSPDGGSAGSPRRAAGRVRARLQSAPREGGIGGMAAELHKGLLFRMYDRVLDRRMQVAEPGGIGTATQLGGLTVRSENHHHGVDYAPTPYSVLAWVFDALEVHYPDWNFVDVGSGRGRVVLAASRIPFRSVTGVEFAKELHDDAKAGLAKLPASEQASADVRLLHADATRFDIPDGPCAFFLFNPFGEEVVERFLDHALASCAADPRPMKFAYFNPSHATCFNRRPELVRKAKGAFEWTRFTLLSPYGFQLHETRSEPV